MKIDDVTLTIFTWDNIPATTYHQGALASSGSNLGLLKIRTDAGLEGHAFLGSATNPASMDGPQTSDRIDGGNHGKSAHENC